MRPTLLRIAAATLCVVPMVPAGTPSFAARPRRHASRYEAISDVRDGPDDLLLVAQGPCGHRPRHECAGVFRSVDAGRSWTKTRRPPGPLNGSTLTSVGPDSAWLSEVGYHRPARTFITTDDGTHWRQLRLTNVESVVTVGSTVYVAKAHSLFVGTAAARSLRWIGPSVGGQLVVAGDTVYNYPKAFDRLRHWGPRLVAINGDTIRAVAQPCPRAVAREVAITGDADGSLLAVCAGEPGMGQQLKRSFVSWDGAATWRRSGTPSASGYTGSVAARGAAATFVETGRASPQTTYDDGRSWQFLHVGAADPTDGEWRVGFDSTGEYGWAVVGTGGSALYLTDDGGRTWHVAATAELRG